MKIIGRRSLAVIGCLAVAGVVSGCLSNSLTDRKIARYRPKVNDRGSLSQATKGAGASAIESTPANALSKILKRGDRISIELRGIPTPESIRADINNQGVNLPLIGPIEIEGRSASQAEKLIERAYIDGGFYTKINVIVTSQDDEYYVQGEVKQEGKYPMQGDRSLLQAITAAGGYTDFAKKSNVKVIRGQGKDKQVLVFDCERIEQNKEKDPLVKSGDIIVVPRRWFL